MVEGLVQDTPKGQMGLNVPHKMILHPPTSKGGAFVLKLGSVPIKGGEFSDENCPPFCSSPLSFHVFYKMSFPVKRQGEYIGLSVSRIIYIMPQHSGIFILPR